MWFKKKKEESKPKPKWTQRYETVDVDVGRIKIHLYLKDRVSPFTIYVYGKAYQARISDDHPMAVEDVSKTFTSYGEVILISPLQKAQGWLERAEESSRYVNDQLNPTEVVFGTLERAEIAILSEESYFVKFNKSIIEEIE
jgi:hypothetical protein